MIRWLLIALFIYMLYKLIRGPKSRRKKSWPKQNNPFNAARNNGRGWGRKPDFDQIEEAEFEDITEKEKKSEQNQ